ncbi:MAG: hypothetical protein COC24_003195 [Alphaproteobacteria bacterium]|nr:hypothetical protein [Alphaproteobacteria bacterium]
MKNLELIQFAFNHLNSKEMHAISESFSPNFSFSTPRFKSLNFEQYCEYIDFVSSILEANVKQVSFSDRGVFTIKVSFNIVDNSSKYQKNLEAIGKVIIQDNLIQSLNITYKANQLDLKIIMKIAASIVNHFKNLGLNN